MTSPAASAVQGLNQGPPAKRSMKIEEVQKPTDQLCKSMTFEEVKHWLKGYEAFMDQDVKASKVWVGLVRCRRLTVNENEALEAVADKVDDDIDPIPKDEHKSIGNSNKLEAWEDIRPRRRYTKVHAKGPKVERRYKNQFITDPNAPNAGKDAPDTEDH